jgi:hypothetical protein
MEINIVQRIFGTLMLSCYLFAPEIAEIKKGKFTKTIVATFLFTLFSIRLDIQYFITNYPQRAIVTLFVGILSFFIYLKYSDILKNIRLENKIKRLRKNILIYYNERLDWIYFSSSDDYIQEIERMSFSSVWKNFRVLILLISIFNHFTLKFLNYSFALTFLLLSTLYSTLFLGRLIKKYPLRIYVGTLLFPWPSFFFLYFFCKNHDVQVPFLYLGLDKTDWLASIVNICVFWDVSVLIGLIFWTILSIATTSVLKKTIQFLKPWLLRLPIFTRQSKKAKLIQMNLQKSLENYVE